MAIRNAIRKIDNFFRDDSNYQKTYLLTLIYTILGLMADGILHGIYDRNVPAYLENPFHYWVASGAVALSALATLKHFRWGGLPPGYGITLWAGFVLLFAMFADVTWHTLLGIEQGLAAAFSPNHELLIAGIVMALIGPVRGKWKSSEDTLGGREFFFHAHWLMIVIVVSAILHWASMLGALWMSSKFAEYVSNYYLGVFTDIDTKWYMNELAGSFKMVFFPVVWLLLIMKTVLRFKSLPWAFWTTTILAHTLGAQLLYLDFRTFAIALLIGITADVLTRMMDPRDPNTVQKFCVWMTGAMQAAMLLLIFATDGTYWPLHMWTGATGLAIFGAWCLGDCLKTFMTPRVFSTK